jgi:hypothetical protein
VVISIFRMDDRSLDTRTVSATEDSDQLEKMAEATGYGIEEVIIPGASHAYCVTGPFGAYTQVVAQFADGMVFNVSSEASGQDGEPPLDRAGVEELLSLLVQEL